MKVYIMGNYTEKAFQGFLKDPKRLSTLFEYLELKMN